MPEIPKGFPLHNDLIAGRVTEAQREVVERMERESRERWAPLLDAADVFAGNMREAARRFIEGETIAP